jgi:hypothetical protein
MGKTCLVCVTSTQNDIRESNYHSVIVNVSFIVIVVNVVLWRSVVGKTQLVCYIAIVVNVALWRIAVGKGTSFLLNYHVCERIPMGECSW